MCTFHLTNKPNLRTRYKLENPNCIKEITTPTFVNSVKFKVMPSRLSILIARIQTDPLKGVVAPPKLVPNTRADHKGAELTPLSPLMIGVNVRAIAVLLTIVLPIPLIQRAARVEVKVFPPLI